MRGRAKITLFGYVGRDPVTPSEKHPDFVTFPMAVTEHWKDNTGDKQSRTDWYEIVTSQKGLGGIVQMLVRKGEPLYVEGIPKYGLYTSKDGEVKSKVTVNLTELILLGNKSDDEQAAEISNNNKAKYETIGKERYIPTTPPAERDPLDDEIPF